MSKRKKDSYAKKQQRAKTAVGIFIILLMVTSILGIVVSNMGDTAETKDYKDMKVTTTNIGFQIEKDGVKYNLENHPSVIEQFDVNVTDNFNAAIISFNANSDLGLLPYYDRAKVSFLVNFQKLGKGIGYAITENYVGNISAYAQYPVADCSYQNETVIVLDINNESKVTQEGNCITVSARSGSELLLAKDAIIYELMK